jgi:hypothetical protein
VAVEQNAQGDSRAINGQTGAIRVGVGQIEKIRRADTRHELFDGDLRNVGMRLPFPVNLVVSNIVHAAVSEDTYLKGGTGEKAGPAADLNFKRRESLLILCGERGQWSAERSAKHSQEETRDEATLQMRR